MLMKKIVSIGSMAAIVIAFVFLIINKQTEGPSVNDSTEGDVSTSAPSKSAEKTIATEYSCVKISFLSENKQNDSGNTFKLTDPQAVSYIDSFIRTSTLSIQKNNLENNHTKQYLIEVTNEVGGYSCKLYYDTLYQEAYMVKDGGLVEIETDFARYLNSFFENKNVIFDIDKTDAALFKEYGWTLDYQINELKSELVRINTLFNFDPQSYYFSYNNELSKDIGLDMSRYENTEILVKIYRIHESMPQKFYPIQDCRGIIVKNDGKTIGAFISAGRHSTFYACSLKGNNFEDVTGKTFSEWIAYKVKVDNLEERLSKLKPEQVIIEYFEALDSRDIKRAKSCVSREILLENLSVNMGNENLYNNKLYLPFTDVDTGENSDYTNLKSAKVLKIELIEDQDSNNKIFRVSVDLQYNKEISISSGKQTWECSMIFESLQTGWKIKEFGM